MNGTLERLNLDANATYGVPPELMAYLSEVLPTLFNPSSVHVGGQRARAIIEDTRDALCAFVGADRSSKVIFTSGATEANNMAIMGFFRDGPAIHNENAHLIISDLEHPSVLECGIALQNSGWKVSRRSPIGTREEVIKNFSEPCGENTRLVSIMMANNETGDIYSVKEIAHAIKALYPGIIIHSDGVQALGKMEVDFKSSGIDLLTISGHKVGALPGVGALIVRESVELSPLIRGGAQERGLRAGTENVAGIAALGWTLERLKETMKERLFAMRLSRNMIIDILKSKIPEIEIHTSLENSIPNTISLRIPGVPSDDLVVALDLRGIQISSGAACSSGKPAPSHVLIGMGLPVEIAKESIRISLTHQCSREAASFAAKTLAECAGSMKRPRSVKDYQGVALYE